MKTNQCRRRFISQAQLDRAAIIVAGQWPEVMSVVQQRADWQQQEQQTLLQQARHRYQTRQQAA